MAGGDVSIFLTEVVADADELLDRFVLVEFELSVEFAMEAPPFEAEPTEFVWASLGARVVVVLGVSFAFKVFRLEEVFIADG